MNICAFSKIVLLVILSASWLACEDYEDSAGGDPSTLDDRAPMADQKFQKMSDFGELWFIQRHGKPNPNENGRIFNYDYIKNSWRSAVRQGFVPCADYHIFYETNSGAYEPTHRPHKSQRYWDTAKAVQDGINAGLSSHCGECADFHRDYFRAGIRDSFYWTDSFNPTEQDWRDMMTIIESYSDPEARSIPVIIASGGLAGLSGHTNKYVKNKGLKKDGQVMKWYMDFSVCIAGQAGNTITPVDGLYKWFFRMTRNDDTRQGWIIDPQPAAFWDKDKSDFCREVADRKRAWGGAKRSKWLFQDCPY